MNKAQEHWTCPDRSCGFVKIGRPKKPRVSRCDRCKRFVLVKMKSITVPPSDTASESSSAPE